MEEQEAFKIVYEKLREFSMFTGMYDAKHCSREYQFGVYLVMEYIASEVGDERFLDEFMENMAKSERRVEQVPGLPMC